MLAEDRVRTLIGSADPVRTSAPPPTHSAADLIARADALSPGRADALDHPLTGEGVRARRPARPRLVLAAAALAVVAVVTAVTVEQIGADRRPSAVDRTGGAGVVVVPI